MTAAGRCTTAALEMLLRDQPLSPGKVALAWSAAVGRAIAGVASVALDAEGTLAVTVADRHWARELNRSRPLITARMKQLLGDGAVTRIEVSSRTTPKQSRTTPKEKQPHARVGHRQRRAPAHR